MILSLIERIKYRKDLVTVLLIIYQRTMGSKTVGVIFLNNQLYH